jgi:site-specific DNA-cytosine methylase
MLKTTRIKLHNTLAHPTLLYGSQNRTIKARDSRRLTTAEMKYIEKQRDKLGQIIKQTQRLQRN